MRVLSLFDGMACGMLAMLGAGVEVESYDAYEIDKYAVQTAQHNFPNIVEHGDVFAEDFTKYEGVDFLVGGSPCTYWSIAQTQNRETTASGLGWKLFSQYVHALHEAKPKFFIYENNKSMSKAIRDSIRETFGFEEICINSALVSAQNRQRYYWVGKRNEDGTYSKVDVKQPEDRGILLKDVLDGAYGMNNIKAIIASDGCVAEPVCTARGGKPFAITASEWKGGNVKDTITKHRRTQIAEPVRVGTYPGSKCPECDSKQYRIYHLEGKAVTQCGQGGGLGAKTGLYAVPVGCSIVGRRVNADGHRDDYNENLEHFQRVEINENPQKSRCVSTVSKDNPICEPVEQLMCVCNDESMDIREATKKGRATIEQGNCVDMTQPNSKTRRGRSMADKSNCLTTGPQYYQYVGTYQYATPCEWDENGIPTKAVSSADGKTYTVYPVQDGQITINGKTYPIKLIDGYYIIRKLTVSECKRLQTVPEWYEFPVSDTQAFRQLGNGWTVQIIVHLIKACLEVMA